MKLAHRFANLPEWKALVFSAGVVFVGGCFLVTVGYTCFGVLVAALSCLLSACALLSRKRFLEFQAFRQVFENFAKGGFNAAGEADFEFVEHQHLNELLVDASADLQEILLTVWKHSVELQSFSHDIQELLQETEIPYVSAKLFSYSIELSTRASQLQKFLEVFNYYDIEISKTSLFSKKDRVDRND